MSGVRGEGVSMNEIRKMHEEFLESRKEDVCRELLREHNAEMLKKKDTAVEHPPHYKPGKFEVIDVIEDWNLNFHLGNAVKYIARAGRKDPAKRIEDLRKALWYLSREIGKDIA